MDVQYLHTGEPVVVLSDGQGEPGEFVTDGSGRKVWQTNGDYQPSRIVRLGAVEEVEPGQIAGSSYDDTAVAARAAAIESGQHPDTEGVQFVHAPTAAGGGSPVVGADAQGVARTPLGPEATGGAAGATTDELAPLSTDERAELEQLRAQVAGGEAVDRAGVEGRNTGEDTRA